MRHPAALALMLALGIAAGWWLLREEPAGETRPRRAPRDEAPVAAPFAGRQSVVVDEADVERSKRVSPRPSRRAAIERNNEAARSLEAGEIALAVAILEELVATWPEETAFRHNLAEAQVRAALAAHEAQRLADAVRALERALELGRADEAELRALLERWRKERELARAHFSEGSSLFDLAYDGTRTDILHHSQRVLDHLERSYDELREWFGTDPVRHGGRERVRVVLHDRAAFGELTGLGDWAGGAFDGTVRVAVEDLLAEEDAWRRTLKHELVHVFVAAVGGAEVPGWLNEGLAQVLEGPSRSIGADELGAWFALERLEGNLSTWEDASAIQRAYLQSQVLVEHLAREYGNEAVRRMVSGCAEGSAPSASFEAYTSVPLAFVLERLR